MFLASVSWQHLISEKYYFFISPIFKNCNFPQLNFGIEPRSTHSETKDLVRVAVVKNSCFCSMPYNPNCPNNEKNFWFSPRRSNSFSSGTDFISSVKVSIKVLQPVETFSMENCRFCSLHWKTDCPIFQILVFRLTHLNFQTPNSHYPQACIFHFDLHRKTETCEYRLVNQNVDVFLASEIWRCDIFEQSLLFRFNSSCKIRFVRHYMLLLFP